ncbi:MAG: radical SAM protein [Clostridiales bacterium]|nr:radical SAM protein [Clostridiales bacterium]
MISIFNNVISFIGENEEFFKIEKENYKDILSYLKTGDKNEYINFLEEIGIKEKLFKDKEKLLFAMKRSLKKVELAFPVPNSFNIELTTRCPLRCPQCYCFLDSGMDIDIEVAKKYIKEASNIGVNYVNLSGGETLAYPNLFKLISFCTENNIISSIAISGWNFDKKVLSKLIHCGINSISVSLNGSTEEINSKTRDGYKFAINALDVLNKSNFNNYTINWVAHNSNIDDFTNLVKLAKKYNVRDISVLSAKPDASFRMDTIPTIDNFIKLGDFIKGYKDDKLEINVEDCYQSLLFYVNEDNLYKDYCMAGVKNFSISVEGKFTPCRHINYEEEASSIIEYWENSMFLKKLRKSNLDVREPCVSCKYCDKCNPCAAINYKVNNELYKGNKYCYINNINK